MAFPFHVPAVDNSVVFQVSGDVYRVLYSRCQVLYFRCQVLYFRCQVLYFRCHVSGLSGVKWDDVRCPPAPYPAVPSTTYTVGAWLEPGLKSVWPFLGNRAPWMGSVSWCNWPGVCQGLHGTGDTCSSELQKVLDRSRNSNMGAQNVQESA